MSPSPRLGIVGPYLVSSGLHQLHPSYYYNLALANTASGTTQSTGHSNKRGTKPPVFTFVFWIIRSNLDSALARPHRSRYLTPRIPTTFPRALQLHPLVPGPATTLTLATLSLLSLSFFPFSFSFIADYPSLPTYRARCARTPVPVSIRWSAEDPLVRTRVCSAYGHVTRALTARQQLLSH